MPWCSTFLVVDVILWPPKSSFDGRKFKSDGWDMSVLKPFHHPGETNRFGGKKSGDFLEVELPPLSPLVLWCSTLPKTNSKSHWTWMGLENDSFPFWSRLACFEGFVCVSFREVFQWTGSSLPKKSMDLRSNLPIQTDRILDQLKVEIGRFFMLNIWMFEIWIY